MATQKNLILIGGGGHCLSCIDVIESTEKYTILGILDGGKSIGQKVGGYDILGSDKDLAQFVPQCDQFVITIGQVKSSGRRKDLYREVNEAGGTLPAIIADTAHVSSHAHIGSGTMIMHHAFVNANVRIGSNCIINTGAIIEHEAVIGNHCHISTGAIINGQVILGDDCFMGSKAVVANNINITSGTNIGMGSAVLSDIEVRGTYVGLPAKKTGQ